MASALGQLSSQHLALAAASRTAAASLRRAHCLQLAALVEAEEMGRCQALAELSGRQDQPQAFAHYAAKVNAAVVAAAARVSNAGASAPDLAEALKQHAAALAAANKTTQPALSRRAQPSLKAPSAAKTASRAMIMAAPMTTGFSAVNFPPLAAR